MKTQSERQIDARWAHLRNLRMAEKLTSGEAIDVNQVGKKIADGVFELTDFEDGKDYCDAQREEWIWSIGRSYADDSIKASTAANFYQNPSYECLFLR